MKIVAFLQNMWVRDPDKVRRMIARDHTGKLREKLIHYSLFAGCLTGRRLKAALGEDLCEQILWEEASPAIDDNPKRYHAPDKGHIYNVLFKHKPDVVICFTRAGENAIREVCESRFIAASARFIPSIHPAARAVDVLQQLKSLRTTLETLAGHSQPSGFIPQVSSLTPSSHPLA